MSGIKVLQLPCDLPCSMFNTDVCKLLYQLRGFRLMTVTLLRFTSCRLASLSAQLDIQKGPTSEGVNTRDWMSPGLRIRGKDPRYPASCVMVVLRIGTDFSPNNLFILCWLRPSGLYFVWPALWSNKKTKSYAGCITLRTSTASSNWSTMKLYAY